MSDANSSPFSVAMVEVLEAVRRRKAMYFSPVTVEAAETFLGGFVTGCFACGVRDLYSALDDAVQARGWRRAPGGPIPGMRATGMPEEAMIDGLIEIHTEALRRTMERMQDQREAIP